MAFINTESGVCLSTTGTTVFPVCGKIIEEGPLKYIITEGEKKVLKTDGSCSDGALVSFSCEGGRKYVDSGQAVIISNTCSLPITITGFRNSDPERFTIFQYPEYLGVGIYESEYTAELPVTLDPFTTLSIPTFFHPLDSELEKGTAGTFDNRIGDAFNAEIDIYPGFPILNCPSEDVECDAEFTLSGEFICDLLDTPDWLSNEDNFVVPDLSELPSIDNVACLEATDTYTAKNLPNPCTVKGIYAALSQLADGVYSMGFKETRDPQSKWTPSRRAALWNFNVSIKQLIILGGDDDIGRLINYPSVSGPTTLPDQTSNGDAVELSAFYPGGTWPSNPQAAPNTGIIAYLKPGTYTGMNYQVTKAPSWKGAYSPQNSTVFFNIDCAKRSTSLFVAESGNFETTQICIGEPVIRGCTDQNADNYNPEATIDDGSCTYPPPAPVLGCTDDRATNYDPAATQDDGSCIIEGCTDPAATNYVDYATPNNPQATNCTYPQPAPVLGCTDDRATNYNPDATQDDGSCIILGCTDSTATNYVAYATAGNPDAAKCTYPVSTPCNCTLLTTKFGPTPWPSDLAQVKAFYKSTIVDDALNVDYPDQKFKKLLEDMRYMTKTTWDDPTKDGDLSQFLAWGKYTRGGGWNSGHRKITDFGVSPLAKTIIGFFQAGKSTCEEYYEFAKYCMGQMYSPSGNTGFGRALDRMDSASKTGKPYITNAFARKMAISILLNGFPKEFMMFFIPHINQQMQKNPCGGGVNDPPPAKKPGYAWRAGTKAEGYGVVEVSTGKKVWSVAQWLALRAYGNLMKGLSSAPASSATGNGNIFTLIDRQQGWSYVNPYWTGHSPPGGLGSSTRISFMETNSKTIKILVDELNGLRKHEPAPSREPSNKERAGLGGQPSQWDKKWWGKNPPQP